MVVASPQGDGIGREGRVHQKLLHHGMAPVLDGQFPTVHKLGAAPPLRGGHLGEGGQGIEFGHLTGCGANRLGLEPRGLAQGREELQLPLGGTGAQPQDASLPLLEGRGDEALLAGEGLAADPVVGHSRRFGATHGQEIAEGAVVLETNVGMAAALALLAFLVGQPAILIIQLVAKAIELGKTKDDFVIQGRIAYHVIPNSFKVYLKVDPDVAARRIMQDIGNPERNSKSKTSSLEEIKRISIERDKSDAKRYEKIYGIKDFSDPSNYNLVIDTTEMGIDEIAEHIMSRLR